MIAQITGLLIEKQAPTLIIDVGGLGYECQAPVPTCAALSEGTSVTLFTRVLYREDGHFMYGFLSREERDLFGLVLKVNGVGPKSALAILSAMDPLTLVRCIEMDEQGMLTKIPGIGKKTAAKMVLELKDKMEPFKQLATLNSKTSTILMRPSETQQAIQALESLGYKSALAVKAIEGLEVGSEASCEVLVKLALQSMGIGSRGNR